ncbi:MAG: hypothetical protein WCR44_06045 [Verrucomicrobiota bacterium]|jgi:hypothetical protein
MTAKKCHLILGLFLVSKLSVSLLASDLPLWERLTPQQQMVLSSGKQVVLEEEVPDSPWPNLTIYQLVKSSSAEVAAVFWNSELDTKYLPNCKSVRILDRPSRDVQKAEFILRMPLFLPEELYVSRITIKSPSSNVYEISWKVLESLYSKECNGTIRIEPHGDLALFSYQNFVKPRSNFAALLRLPAQAIIVDSVKFLVRQVETERQKNPQLLAAQLKAIEVALGKR